MMISTTGLWLLTALAFDPPQQAAVPEPTVAAAQTERAPEPTTPPSKRTPRPSSRRGDSPDRRSFEEPRSSRESGPLRQEVTLSGSIQGGYDDNVTVGLGSGVGSSPEAMISGATAAAAADLAFFRGNNRHSLRVRGAGTLTGYPENLDRPAPGATADIHAMTTLGRDTTVFLTERAAYSSLFSVSSLSPGDAPAGPGDGDPAQTSGLYERTSVNSTTSASIDRRWGRSTATAVSYEYGVRRFTSEDYGDTTTQSVEGEYRQRLANGVRGTASYRFRDTEYLTSEALTKPSRDHRVEGGAEVQKRLSRTREMSLSLVAGAAYVDSESSTTGSRYQTWMPTGSASLSIGVTPTWSIDGGYRRDFAYLNGVTDDVYATDTARLFATGFVSEDISIRLGTTYSNWRTPLASGASDTLNIYGGTVQFQWLITERMAATAGYYYYYHQYSNPAALPEGFPAEYDRHAVRVGLSFSVPLAGDAARQPRGRR